MTAALQAAAALAAAAAAASVLLLADRRARARAMLAALALAALALATIAADVARDAVAARPVLVAAGAGAALALVGGLTVLLARQPAALAPLAIAALPFRIPVPVADDTVYLLLPLYAVIAAACLAHVARTLRRPAASAAPAGADGENDDARDRRVRRVELALAAVIVLYALQALYSPDVPKAVRNVVFFYVPFALLFRLALDIAWSRRLVFGTVGLAAGLALVFAAVGFVEYATRHLLLFNPKVVEANQLKPYFRVNSLFFDPNVYGRFLAVTMVALATALLWIRRSRDVGLLAAALAILWAGLVLSLSQSSFAALLVGLVVLAALRWSVRLVAALGVGGLAAAVAVVALAPQAVGLQVRSWEGLDRATSGRVGLVRAGVDMVRDRPLWGVGAAGFEDEYRRRERVYWSRLAAESHTIPVTVAAEQGAIGLLAYLVLVWASLALVFGRRRRGPPAAPPVLRAGAAATFCALFVHTLVYAAFLEDPLTWTLLAIAAAWALRPVPGLERPRTAADAKADAVVPGAVPAAS